MRVLSPKTMGFGDWDTSGDWTTLLLRATQCSHFFDDYITGHCWTANRQFTFYNKLWSTGTPNPAQYLLWGKTDIHG